MLHVFHVDLGVLYTFEMEFAMESVQVLMSTVASVSGIPEDKQVLLISSGEALDPTERVYSYSSAGTDTNPIFLFSKSTIESSIPPSPSLNLGSETNLKEQVEKSLNLPPTYETLVSRAQLASDFDTLAAEITQSCENLVWEQKMQQNGWAAVVANLENIASEFKARANGVHQIYTEFLDAKPRYIEQLEGFKQVLPLLSRVSVLPCLLTRQQLSVGEQTSRFSLLDWISAQDTKNSLQDMAKQCEDAIEQFDESQLTEITNEVSQVLESLDNTSMKEIKGLDDRLAGLQQLLQNVQTLMQSQADMAQGFQKNQARAQNIGDPSVLPDLCTSHQKQLMLLRKNHTHLRDLRKRFAKAKDELSVNLHTRLRWIMYVEKKICDCDSTVIMYHENIRRIKRRLEIIEQVNEAPRLYILAVSEVVRRRTFSSQFQKWASKLSNISVQARAEEIARREDFELHFGHHFLQNLFGGLEDRPPRFLDKPPKGFDELLPIITERDLQELQEQIPELSTYLDFSPINISMKDETGKVSGLQSEEHKNLEAIFQFQPMFVGSKTIESMTYKKASHVVTEMSASEDKGTQMSIDASTQVEWAVEEDECSPSKMEPELEMSSTQNLAGKEEITELSSKAATQQTVRTADVSSTHERKKSSSESASEESDLVFRSAHDDYVTVFEADLEGDPQELDVPLVSQPVGECQEQCVALLDEASQTTTLTSSGTQSSDQSTQTEHSFDENWPVQESGIQGVLSQTVLDLEQQASDRTRQTSLDDMVERLSQLEARLSSTQEVLERTSAEKQQLQEANSNVREFWCREMQEIRNFLSKEKQLISEWDLQIKEDILEGISKVRQIQEKDHNYIAQSIAQRTKEEFEKKTTQLSLEFEKERNVFLEDKVKLECEKIEILKQLEQLRIDKETSEIQHQEESHKLASLLGEYKAKLDEQQGTAQKLQENKSRSDEDQQIRFNAIIMKLKREKEQAVSQAQEKLNELKSLLEQQEEGMRLLVMEKENIEQARKREHDEFCQREENLLTDLQSKEAKIKEAETVMKTKEAEFQEQLEQEKISALMLLQVEQQMWEANRKVQATDTARETKCSTDTVQEEDHQQKIRALEEENQKLRERLSEGIGTDEGSQLVKFRQVLDIKDQEILSLQQQLSQMQKMTGTASAAAGASKSDKISLRDFQVGDLILLLFEERYENYLVLSTGQTLFFLHPDSMAGLDLATSGPKRRPWMLAQMTDKEYCQAKKPHNRFHVPVGTKFYRIQAKSWKW